MSERGREGERSGDFAPSDRELKFEVKDMPFVSLTRLRVRSVRFLPMFVVHMLASLRQVKRAVGFRHGALLADRNWTFWTMTAWDDQESMRGYMTTASHKSAMTHLLDWCDEASVAHWMQSEETLPSWTDADKRMRTSGRASKVRYPSRQHADLTYDVLRTTGGAIIRR
jgi:hypothetical protein